MGLNCQLAYSEVMLVPIESFSHAETQHFPFSFMLLFPSSKNAQIPYFPRRAVAGLHQIQFSNTPSSYRSEGGKDRLTVEKVRALGHSHCPCPCEPQKGIKSWVAPETLADRETPPLGTLEQGCAPGFVWTLSEQPLRCSPVPGSPLVPRGRGRAPP